MADETVRPRTVERMFEEQVGRTPDAAAVIYQGRHWTYRELNRRANQVAHHLRRRGVGADVLVGVCLERSLEMAATILGVLKAGGAYLPLDTGYPGQRLTYMLDNARAPVLLTWAGLRDRVPAGAAELLCLDTDADRLVREPGHDPNPVDPPDRLAYVIYTSGSTGQPKGIAMGQRALVNLIEWQVRNSPFGVGDRTLQFASLSFDVSFQEMFSTWCSGGTLVMIPEGLRRDPTRLAGLLTAQRVNRLFLPFIALQRLAEAVDGQPGVLADLREVITAGEQLQVTPRVAELFARRPRCTLHNQYGPTESHVVTAHTLAGPPDTWPALPPIGRPIDNTYVRLLDAEQRPVAAGEPGELYLGGICLARGYLHRPELTAERFLPDPFGSPGDRLYRTGDRARFLPDGNLEFLGRVDHQVKICGFRVELGEVEAALSQHPRVREAVVACPPGRGERRLLAYLVAEPHQPPAAEELRQFLRDRLPVYMVPSAFVRLDALPLTPSGKVDRASLPAPSGGRPDLKHSAVPPRDDLELRLVQLWQEVLNVAPVGRTDSFAELGGDSLQAADMLLQVRRQLGKDPPLQVLGRELTVEWLAVALASADDPEPWSALVPLRPHGDRPPLFFVHGIGGEVVSFGPLLRHLHPDQPVYGLQIPAVDGVCQHFPAIEAMAAHYVAELLAARPEGELLLGGYSLGGAVAFEMARQLAAQGRRAALVAVVDERAPGSRWGVGAGLGFAGNLGPWLWEELRRQTPGQFVAHVGRRSWSELRKRARVFRNGSRQPAPVDISGWVNHRLSDDFRALCEHNYRILLAYAPEAYPGAVTVVRARTQPFLGPHETDLGWGRLATGGATVHVVPGTHASILSEPRVGALADTLQAALTRATDPS